MVVDCIYAVDRSISSGKKKTDQTGEKESRRTNERGEKFILAKSRVVHAKREIEYTSDQITSWLPVKRQKFLSNLTLPEGKRRMKKRAVDCEGVKEREFEKGMGKRKMIPRVTS